MKTTEGKPSDHSHNPTSSSTWASAPNLRKESRLYRTNTRKLSLISSEGREAKKICRVCGDKAFSYNFNVISCESCKAFFRRNANKQKEIRCPFNNSCVITKLSRRFCQRCRLQKCFDVGMKKEWIMSEKARLEKRQRIIANRERRAAESGILCNEKN
uniref:Nuclear receptor domain-containing protein n=1 Tax=Syphacia muris TaxID=451379 RepID=A0A0N5AFR0_9BILA